MVDDRPDDNQKTPASNRRKRAPPTIDLTASEVSDAATASAESIPAETDVPAPNFENPIPDAKPDNMTPATATSSSGFSSAIVAAISGAIAALLVIGAAWWTGVTGPDAPTAAPVPQASSAAIDSLSARVAAVETRPATPSISPPAADPAIAARLDTLERTVASLRDQATAISSQSEKLAAAVNEIKAAPRETSPPPQDLSAIERRLAQIERGAQALRTETSQRSAAPADDTALRRIVAANVLDGAVRQGEPYAASLAAARPLAADTAALQPLEMFASSGLPDQAALSRELLALLPKLAPAEKTSGGSGSLASVLDRLQSGATRLVRIERTDAAPGDDRAAIVARINASARRNDIADARREIAALTPADRTVLQPWLDRVSARDAALAAARQFAADALAAFSKPAP